MIKIIISYVESCDTHSNCSITFNSLFLEHQEYIEIWNLIFGTSIEFQQWICKNHQVVQTALIWMYNYWVVTFACWSIIFLLGNVMIAIENDDKTWAKFVNLSKLKYNKVHVRQRIARINSYLVLLHLICLHHRITTTATKRETK